MKKFKTKRQAIACGTTMCLFNVGAAVVNIMGMGWGDENGRRTGLFFAGFFIAHAYIFPLLVRAVWRKESRSKRLESESKLVTP